MQILNILSGVKVYQSKRYSILFGSPPEVIKHLMMKKILMPDYILIPDTIHRFGVLQNATEFPLYYYLFILKKLFEGQKLNIMGNFQQVHNNRELLHLTLLGPTLEEYKALGDNPYYSQLYRESRVLSIKDKDQNELAIDDLVNFYSFDNNMLETKDFQLYHKDSNVYEIEGNIIDINFTEPQIPPYDLRADFIPHSPLKFGVDVLGGASGFSAVKPCSGLLLNYNSNYMLIDCPPYLEYSLNARGISKQQVKSIFLTHIHDDHCNIFPLILFNNKVKFLGTKEIFWMACRKLALMTQHHIESFFSYFDFVELTPYEKNEFYGMTITPHYTVHSIPTIGATFTMTCDNHNRSLVFVGDNKALTEIKKMVDSGDVENDKFNYLTSLYTDPHDLIFPDGGMGLLHGDPRDSLGSKAHRVIFLHLENLPKEFDTTFTLASHGKRFIIQEETDKAYLISTMLILNHHYPGITEEWESALLSNLTISKYNAGDVIMKQGEPSDRMIYIILSGNVSVLYHDGKELRELAVKETSDIIGDMAAINEVKTRSASIVAKTPVTLCEISEELFSSFIRSEHRIESIKKMWQIRSELEVHFPFSRFSDIINDKIARQAKRLSIGKNQVIIEQGSAGKEFFIVLAGEFAIIKNGVVVSSLKEGAMFGEYGSLGDQIRNATVKAIEPGVILDLHQNEISQIVDSTPSLGFFIDQMMKERNEIIPKPKK